MAKKHSVKQYGHTDSRCGSLIRRVANDPYYDDGICYEWKARGNVHEAALMAGDPDTPFFRARRSAGWKNSKNRHQWEHRINEREKHEKNRAKKARRSAAPGPDVI